MSINCQVLSVAKRGAGQTSRGLRDTEDVDAAEPGSRSHHPTPLGSASPVSSPAGSLCFHGPNAIV